jgi:hypothetical protein
MFTIGTLRSGGDAASPIAHFGLFNARRVDMVSPSADQAGGLGQGLAWACGVMETAGRPRPSPDPLRTAAARQRRSNKWLMN